MSNLSRLMLLATLAMLAAAQRTRTVLSSLAGLPDTLASLVEPVLSTRRSKTTRLPVLAAAPLVPEVTT